MIGSPVYACFTLLLADLVPSHKFNAGINLSKEIADMGLLQRWLKLHVLGGG
jgi:hypothetical protein